MVKCSGSGCFRLWFQDRNLSTTYVLAVIHVHLYALWQMPHFMSAQMLHGIRCHKTSE